MGYMDDKYIKRGYYFPPKVLEAWEKFHAPSKDYSPSAAGAFLVWMSLGPVEREQFRRAAFSANMENAIAKVRNALSQSFVDAQVHAALKKLSPAAKAKILSGSTKPKVKSRKK